MQTVIAEQISPEPAPSVPTCFCLNAMPCQVTSSSLHLFFTNLLLLLWPWAFAIYVSGDLRLSYRLPWMWLTPPDGFKQPVPQPGQLRKEAWGNAIPRVSLQIAIYSHSSSFSCILYWEHAALSGCLGRSRWSQPLSLV